MPKSVLNILYVSSVDPNNNFIAMYVLCIRLCILCVLHTAVHTTKCLSMDQYNTLICGIYPTNECLSVYQYKTNIALSVDLSNTLQYGPIQNLCLPYQQCFSLNIFVPTSYRSRTLKPVRDAVMHLILWTHTADKPIRDAVLVDPYCLATWYGRAVWYMLEFFIAIL